MADCFFIPAAYGREQTTFLAANSQRESNEAQNILFIPGEQHPSHAQVQCTYREIPQEAKTFAILISQPYGSYGAEIGISEKGVAGATSGAFTNQKYQIQHVLTGQDLLRLALERSRNAAMAIDIIVNLISAYGQGGFQSKRNKTIYHASFLLADPQEAWVLETAGQFWAAQRVTQPHSLTGGLTIGRDFERHHAGLLSLPRKTRRKQEQEPFHFKNFFERKLFAWLSRSHIRSTSFTAFWQNRNQKISTWDMFALMRDHGPEPDHLERRGLSRSCMHYCGILSLQTANSVILELRPKLPPLLWTTATSSPCMSLFKPIPFYPAALRQFAKFEQNHFYPMFPYSRDTFQNDSLWWQQERLNRKIMLSYDHFIEILRHERDEIEEMLIREQQNWAKNFPSMYPDEKQWGEFFFAQLQSHDTLHRTKIGQWLELINDSLADSKNHNLSPKCVRIATRENKKAGVPT